VVGSLVRSVSNSINLNCSAENERGGGRQKMGEKRRYEGEMEEKKGDKSVKITNNEMPPLILLTIVVIINLY
jgi:hypothetical protein